MNETEAKYILENTRGGGKTTSNRIVDTIGMMRDRLLA